MQVYRIPIDQDSRMEMTRHGTEGFPMAVYETVLAKNTLGFVDWHWHDEFQFCLVTEGQVRFHVGNGIHLLAAGMGLFINSGILHMAKPLTANAAYHCMDVSPKLMGSFPESDIHSRYLKRFLEDPTRRYILLSKDVPWQSLVLEKMGEIYRVYRERAEGFEIWIVSLLMHIFFLLLQSGAEGEAEAVPDALERIKLILNYIHGHFGEKITLKQVSKWVNLCPNECCRYFKSHTGSTIFGYINNLRITKSAEALLNHPERTVSQIAYECGFSTPSYFIEKFRQKTGMTPSQYRKRIGNRESVSDADEHSFRCQ